MNYEIESKLRDKADKWELHNIQNENRELKSHIYDLERKIGNLEGANSNKNYLLDRLLNLLSENVSLNEISNDLHELRGSI
jgi:uncharacterized protein YlxW (UPF0749 family)